MHKGLRKTKNKAIIESDNEGQEEESEEEGEEDEEEGYDRYDDVDNIITSEDFAPHPSKVVL